MKGELTTGFGGNSITLRDGASALFRRRALVPFTFIAVVLGTAVVTYLLPKKYESRMKILVKNQRVDVAITPQATGGAPLGGCLMFWKEAWLKPVDGPVSQNGFHAPVVTQSDLVSLAMRNGEFFLPVKRDCPGFQASAVLAGETVPLGR